jgi:outer membrane receptor for ferrienterochelin and colicin
MKIFLSLLCFVFTVNVIAQPPTGNRRTSGFTSMNAGHIYGRVVDAKTNKSIDGASLQLTGNRFDSATKKMVPRTLRAGITLNNGDFDFDELPVMGNLTLKISAIGYKAATHVVSFGGGRGNRSAGEGGGMESMMNMIDRDLGNIKLEPEAGNLGTVTVSATRQLFEMGVDRKIFNVDRNLVSQGQTATEVMKQIPSLSVDIDGNVTMRNATPQLFIDGRPTTLTLDQIPADIIDRVELLTNPSAQFDASGGNAGILNIVLKKNKRTGYNGGLRAGLDSRARGNIGGDFNFRQGKINFFLNGNANFRRSLSTSKMTQQNLDINRFRLEQNSEGESEARMGFIRGGVDYLIDNRNTVSISVNYNKGQFENEDKQVNDFYRQNLYSYQMLQNTFSKGEFENVGSQLSYKRNFAKPGHELTADVNYNRSNNNNNGRVINQNYAPYTNSPLKPYPGMRNTFGFGNTTNLVMQADYDNPISEKNKFETGVRVAIRNFENSNEQYSFVDSSQKFEFLNTISNKYKYVDQVYAAYAIYSFQKDKMNYQFGLRAESSDYNGELLGRDSTFKVTFPISLFPSAFITRKIDDKQDLQFNFSRRINRPNFFQLMPFINYVDTLNITVGNAALKPEFTNSFELSYNNNYKRGANFLASIFAKHNTDLITRFQYKDANPVKTGSAADSVIFNTYVNANESFTYGLELTNRMTVITNWDMSLNFNLFNSKLTLNDPLLKTTLTNQLTSWFVKWNNTFKLGQGTTVQLSADYYAKTVLPQEGGRGGGGNRGGGGMMFGGGSQATAQGYIKPRYSFDIAIRKEWTLKAGNTLAVNLSMNDFLRTQLFATHSESPFLIQDSERRRDPQVLRLNLNWRFGKFDVNLFKRKNNRQEEDGGGGGGIIM